MAKETFFGQNFIIIIGVIILIILLFGLWYASCNSINFRCTITPYTYEHMSPVAKSTNKKIYYFYSPKCPACINFQKNWNDIKEKLRNNGIDIQEINVNDPSQNRLIFYYNIKWTPEIVLVTPKKTLKYQGDRTKDKILEFITNN